MWDKNSNNKNKLHNQLSQLIQTLTQREKVSKRLLASIFIIHELVFGTFFVRNDRNVVGFLQVSIGRCIFFSISILMTYEIVLLWSIYWIDLCFETTSWLNQSHEGLKHKLFGRHVRNRRLAPKSFSPCYEVVGSSSGYFCSMLIFENDVFWFLIKQF